MTAVDHFIKPLTQTQMPRSVAVMAVASRLGGDRSGYTQTWRCASLHMRHTAKDGTAKVTRRLCWDLDLMWAELSKACAGKGLTFLWVHDLAWAARVTGMLDMLPAHGWRLDALSLAGGASWLVFRRGEATLKVADLLSIWPHSIEQIGQLFGMARKDSPEPSESVIAWNAFVTRDRTILVTAVEAYLAWVEKEQLGTLAVTGSAQAWKALRRSHLTHGILIHHDQELRAMERRAMWTGRCEAYWHGTLLREVADEWDFSMAHNTIAASEQLPVFPHTPLPPEADLRAWIDDPRYAVLAEIEVDTDVPCLPMEMDGHIVWPVGRFRTTVWSPEIRIALDTCRGVRLIKGWAYRREHALRQWAAWVTARMGADDVDVPAWQKDVLKRWSNVVIGRFGMQYPKWTKVGRSLTSGVSCVVTSNSAGEDTGLLMQVGREVWQQTGTTEPRDAAPMITGYVMSVMRAKLWHLMQALPPKALLYVDTDAVLVPDGFRDHMSVLADDPRFAGLRLKRSWDGLSIYGPRQVVTGDMVRVAGLPKAAKRLGRTEFEGEIVESLTVALQGGLTATVRISPRQWKIDGVDTRREGHGFGWTTPFRVNDF